MWGNIKTHGVAAAIVSAIVMGVIHESAEIVMVEQKINEDHAVTMLCRVLEEFIEVHGELPESWDALAGFEPLRHRWSRSVAWPRDASRIRSLCTIAFGADLCVVAGNHPHQSGSIVKSSGRDGWNQAVHIAAVIGLYHKEMDEIVEAVCIEK